MARILDPANALDNPTYNGLRDIMGITSNNATIDANPLFLSAEDYIIALLPAAEDRAYANRVQALRALVYIGAYFMLEGGGTTANTRSEAASGEVKSRSRTIGSLTIREDFNVSASSSSVGGDDRAEFFKEQGDAILASLGASIDTSSDEDLLVLVTDSLLPEGY